MSLHDAEVAHYKTELAETSMIEVVEAVETQRRMLEHAWKYYAPEEVQRVLDFYDVALLEYKRRHKQID